MRYNGRLISILINGLLNIENFQDDESVLIYQWIKYDYEKCKHFLPTEFYQILLWWALY